MNSLITNKPTVSASMRARLARRGCPRTTTNQSGVGLIEVLVAVLVLSIAFLGIAALQAMSLSTNNSAMARSMATVASYSILDAMRADISSAQNGDYNNAADAPLKASNCPTTVGTLAQTQLGQWCSQLGHGLGATATTTGSINCTKIDSTADCTVTISFNDSRAGAGGSSNQQVVTRAML
jgi:type IV pilus assembly protein PilV